MVLSYQLTHLDCLMMIRDDWLGDDSFVAVAAVELEVSMTWHILTWYFDLPTCAGLAIPTVEQAERTAPVLVEGRGGLEVGRGSDGGRARRSGTPARACEPMMHVCRSALQFLQLWWLIQYQR